MKIGTRVKGSYKTVPFVGTVSQLGGHIEMVCITADAPIEVKDETFQKFWYYIAEPPPWLVAEVVEE